MRGRVVPLRALMFCGVALLWAQPSDGAELHLGAVDIHPKLDSSVEYTSNLFGIRNEKDDILFYEAPSIEGALALPWLRVDGGSAWRWIQYAKRPKLNRTDPNYWGNAELRLPHLTLSVKEEYQRQAGVTYTETLSRSATNRLVIGATPHFKRLKLDFEWSDDSTNYKPPNANQDIDITRWSWKLGYPIRPKTDLVAKYVLGHTRYLRTAARDFKAHSLLLGAEGRYWGKLTGEASAGLELRHPEDESQSERLTAVVSSVDLAWVHSPYRTWRFGYERKYRDATFEAAQIGAFLGHQATIELEQSLTYKLVSTWTLKYLWEKGTVPASSTADDLNAKQRKRAWTYQAELAYQFRPWLLANLAVSYGDTDSNFNNNDSTTFSVNTGVKVEL